MPRQSHQRILRYLFRVLEAFVVERQLGEVMFAPLRVQLRPGKYREPDLMFMKTKNAQRREEDFWIGADLVMEIVSDDAPSRERDLVKKPVDYAQAGISEYWIVDPVEQQITVLRLEGQHYQIHGQFVRGTQATSAALAGFTVEVNATLDEGKG